MRTQFDNIAQAINASKLNLKVFGKREITNKWQGQDVKGDNKSELWELLHYGFSAPIPDSLNVWRLLLNPNNPWADKHFEERVGGLPTNPGNTYMIWPFYPKDDKNIKPEIFTHTYQERIWPKQAGEPNDVEGLNWGIRYEYGDLMDVVNLMQKDPKTRQAYLPIWFPEDTGAVHGGRVPCTLGYWFVHRDDYIDIEYHIRACDALRHFVDDVYLAGRLLMWFLNKLRHNDYQDNFYWDTVKPGKLIMNIGSFHVFYKERNTL